MDHNGSGVQDAWQQYFIFHQAEKDSKEIQVLLRMDIIGWRYQQDLNNLDQICWNSRPLHDPGSVQTASVLAFSRY